MSTSNSTFMVDSASTPINKPVLNNNNLPKQSPEPTTKAKLLDCRGIKNKRAALE